MDEVLCGHDTSEYAASHTPKFTYIASHNYNKDNTGKIRMLQ